MEGTSRGCLSTTTTASPRSDTQPPRSGIAGTVSTGLDLDQPLVVRFRQHVAFDDRDDRDRVVEGLLTMLVTLRNALRTSTSVVIKQAALDSRGEDS
jgi:hypothetical protein